VPLSYPEVMLDEFASGRVLGRCLFLDSDSSSIDAIRANKLYGLDNFCCGKNSLAGLFAKGHYTDGSELIDATMDKARKLIERCECPEGFMMSYGIGGGAGSGMGTLLMSKLRDEYPI